MLIAILVLLVCQLVGEASREVLGLPIPGAVVGMFLLAIVLACRGHGPRSVPVALETTAEMLISFMGLLFVPAGVGIITEAQLLGQQWIPILAAVIGSTVLSLVVTSFVMHRIMRGSEKRQTCAHVSIVEETSSC
nr:CidA/LrgA family protein [uncultured Lichenicoccus sp.]